MRAEEVFEKRGFDLVPEDEELFFGQNLAAVLEKETRIIEDEEVNNYLDELGKRLISKAPSASLLEGYEWFFHVIDSQEINAFSILGGRVYVSSGLIAAAETESELAAILAFEMGHLASRHVQQHLSQKAVIRGAVFPGEVIRGKKGLRSLFRIFESEGGVFEYFSSLKYYPEEVIEADEFAIRICSRAGFNPRGLMDITSRLLERERQGYSSLWLQRNSWSARRMENALARLNMYPRITTYEENPFFEEMKSRLESRSGPLPEQKEELSIPEYTEILRVNVLGNIGWTDTGLDVVEGQEIHFSATGGISLQKGNPLAYCGPDGYNSKTMQQPLSDRNIGALIGKIVQLVSVEIDEETGEEIRNEIVEYFYIGSENVVKMNLDGRLFLGINENLVGDNAGEFKVILSVKRS